MEQLSLFDDFQTPPDPTPPPEHSTQKELENLAFLYTATAQGRNSGIKFMMTREDAQTWCNSPTSKGFGRGGHWAYFWTSVWNFIHCYNDFTGTYSSKTHLSVNLDKCHDNGEWDEKITATGAKKIPLDKIPDVLEPLGVECLGKPKATRH